VSDRVTGKKFKPGMVVCTCNSSWEAQEHGVRTVPALGKIQETLPEKTKNQKGMG
jgi:hypothetical protein